MTTAGLAALVVVAIAAASATCWVAVAIAARRARRHAPSETRPQRGAGG